MTAHPPRRLRSLALAPALSVACSFGDWADEVPREVELERVEIEDEAGTRVMVGLDADGDVVSESALFVDAAAAALRIEHDGEWLTVNLSVETGDVGLRIERDGWTYTWDSVRGEPIADDVDARWMSVTYAWRAAISDEVRLADGVSAALNVTSDPVPPEVPGDDWFRLCSTVIDWQCAAGPVTAALGCRLAGLGYCEAAAP